MERKLFATINVAKENINKEVKIYKTKTEKYGIEIVEGDNIVTKKLDNLATDESKVDDLLNVILNSVCKFELVEDYAYDYNDNKKPIAWL